MAAANRHYYATRDPLGATGDFTTAPEISQMFGELAGLWLADLWSRAGKPGVHYVELGPGRGTLAADALRAMKSAGLEPAVHFVETSPTLRERQRERVPDPVFHDGIDTLPGDQPLLIIANEFFDALPVRQLVRTAQGWRERHLGWSQLVFVPVASGPPLDAILPDHLREAAAGSIIETSPASAAIARQLGARLAAQGGAALIVDYGYEGPAIGDTLQAVRGHACANPFEEPGERDLTAHVDFATLAEAARAEGARSFGPVGQGALLDALGIRARAERLSRSAPGRREEIAAAVARLTAPDAMGTLFKALALTGRDWPEPAGFAA
ncbi:class I SAM-dependent methyltransferase [Sphingomonas sp. MAH-20]|uniref:Class I SAM-dependent methyltransferase n=2 Tax=Sphingomonadaceae TaxID=41297 RepID=A0A6I4J0A2_9SPHN|nr:MULTISPECIES: SAM-dependent methyltransferase [Sphingomonas]MBA2918526.1 SAM-dependent methyltransferase [Sphingomonas sp. CGMCC 1.13658]MVO77493.1 class I SAM-dependent methyltransferase [Sphingomonas horti]